MDNNMELGRKPDTRSIPHRAPDAAFAKLGQSIHARAGTDAGIIHVDPTRQCQVEHIIFDLAAIRLPLRDLV